MDGMKVFKKVPGPPVNIGSHSFDGFKTLSFSKAQSSPDCAFFVFSIPANTGV